MLLTGKKKEEITVMTPRGILYHARIEEAWTEERRASCAVRKDGGDDPDVTTGALIYASVSYESVSYERPNAFCEDFGASCGPDAVIRIEGGNGVGVVTRPGLDQPVGSAAINRVPRQMICREVEEVCRLADFHGGLLVEISVPEGERLAEHTFNPRLGITGGISILGTTGIVEPMSTKALLDTIEIELRQQYALGARQVVVSPGNYGLDFMKKRYSYDLDRSVKCSNYIGATIDMAAERGFEAMLLAGHIGKLVKVAGGIMNTHSGEGDCRMELLAASAVRRGADILSVGQVLDCISTEAALDVLEKAGLREPVMKDITERVIYHLRKRAAGRLRMECILYSNELGLLGASEGAESMLV